MEKRKHRRYNKRYKVRFGESFASSGFTGDVSATGTFVVTGTVLPVGQRLHLEISLDDHHKLFFEGLVARVRVVAPELRQIVKGGLGVRFLSGPELIGEMVPHIKDKTRIVLAYPTLAGFQTAFEKELKRGGCFVWTQAHYQPDSIVHLEVDAEFANRAFAFECRVMTVVHGQDGRFGTALMFLDLPTALAGLSELVNA